MSTMDATVELVEGMIFRATPPSGHAVLLDTRTDQGGSGQGPTPIELILLGLGGCTGMDVISMLRKMRQDVTGYTVRVHAERADEHPKVFTSLVVEHAVRGRAISRDSVRRAIELSATRYCSVSAMLSKAARIEERLRIVDEDSGAEIAETLALHG